MHNPWFCALDHLFSVHSLVLRNLIPSYFISVPSWNLWGEQMHRSPWLVPGFLRVWHDPTGALHIRPPIVPRRPLPLAFRIRCSIHSPRSSKPRTTAPFPATQQVKEKGPSLTPTPKGSIFPENTNMCRASVVGRGAMLQLWCQPCDRPAPGLTPFPWFSANLDACPQKTVAWAFWRTVL